MKKYLSKIILLITIVFLFSGCEKFLEKEPIGRIGKQAMFSDVNGAKVALNGTYNLLLNYYRYEFGMYADIASDNLVIRNMAEPRMASQHNFVSNQDEEEQAVGHIWLYIFETLNNTNNILNALPSLEAAYPKQIKEIEAIKGQALVIRALCFFDLSRVYSQPYNYSSDASHLGVPILLKTPSPEDNISRSTIKQTYDQIIKDITVALPLLKASNSTNQVMINYQAAMSLLSRVYLYMGNWEQSSYFASEVIKDPNFTLAAAENYASSFLNYPNSSSSGKKTEHLFSLTAAGLPFSSTSINGILSDTSAANYYASEKLLNSFDADDIRRRVMFRTPVKTTTPLYGKYVTRKHADGFANANVPFFMKVIRLSEVYLNRAEAQWNMKNYQAAAEDIRIISQRAHPDRTITVNYSSPDDLEQQISDERNRELCFEGHRLFDILRRKKSLERGSDCNSGVCTLSYPNEKFVLPISGKELDANRSMQPNPGVNN